MWDKERFEFVWLRNEMVKDIFNWPQHLFIHRSKAIRSASEYFKSLFTFYLRSVVNSLFWFQGIEVNSEILVEYCRNWSCVQKWLYCFIRTQSVLNIKIVKPRIYTLHALTFFISIVKDTRKNLLSIFLKGHGKIAINHEEKNENRFLCSTLQTTII